MAEREPQPSQRGFWHHQAPMGLGMNLWSPQREGVVRLSIPPRAESVRLARDAVDGFARACELTAETVSDLKLAVSEACTNAVLHAGGGAPIEVAFELLPGRVEVEVLDSGSQGEPVPELREGGLGLAIMRSLADELEVGARADAAGTRVRFVKHLSA